MLLLLLRSVKLRSTVQTLCDMFCWIWNCNLL